MRESFIVSAEKNNGYPSFSDSIEFQILEQYGNFTKMFIADDENYPRYSNQNTNVEKVNLYSEKIFFTFSDINDGYPTYLNFYGLTRKIISSIYIGDKPPEIIFLKEFPIKFIYFKEKEVYKFGYQN